MAWETKLLVGEEMHVPDKFYPFQTAGKQMDKHYCIHSQSLRYHYLYHLILTHPLYIFRHAKENSDTLSNEINTRAMD